MKKRLAGWLFAALFSGYCSAQEYKGAFRFSGNDASQAEFYTNVFRVSVSGGEATVTIDLKAGPNSAPNDYVSFSGTLKGKLDPSTLRATGTIHMAMRDGSRFQERDVPGEISGNAGGGQYTGRMYLTVDGRRQGGMEFTLGMAEQVPVLLFPLGNSKKIFDKGWLLGAEFKLTDGNGDEIDLSDNIQWSGTARFEPDHGAKSRPIFRSVGENKIVLTVEYEGKKYKKEYIVTTVDALRYARVGSMAHCPADAHGGPADPLPTVGPIITGNGNVLIDGLPAACEGDHGVHSVCAGPNTFEITAVDCDPDVRINGRMAAKLGTKTRHCGGYGKIISLTMGDNDYANLSNDVDWSREEKGGAKKVITGKNGQVIISPDKNSVMMLLPLSVAQLSDEQKNSFHLDLQDGSLFVNGKNPIDGRSLIVETPKEKLERKGTRFLLTHASGRTRLIVYEGSVSVTLKESGKNILVPAGHVYMNDFKQPYRIEDTTRFVSEDILRIIPKDSTSWQLQIDAGESAAGSGIELLKKYWYWVAGFLVLGALMIYLRRRKK